VRLAFTLGFAGLIIAAAVLAGLVQLALPLVSRHPERIAALLAERLQREVALEAVSGAWEGAGPVLRLTGLRIAANDPAQPALVVPEAELALDFAAGWKKNRRWNEFRLAGLNLQLRRGADGGWELGGFSGGGDAGDNPLLAIGAVVLRDSHLAVDDPARDLHVDLHADELRLLNWGREHRVLGLLRRSGADGAPLEAVLHFDRDSRDGELYLGGDALDLAALLAGIEPGGVRLDSAHGRLQVWASLRGGKAETAHLAFDLRDIAVPPGEAELTALPGFARLARATGVARWQRSAAGWTFEVAELDAARTPSPLGKAGASRFRLAYEATADGTGTYRLDAPQLDVGTFADLAVLAGPALPAGLRRWLFEAAPCGGVRDLVLRYVDARDYDLQARVDGLAAATVGALPGLDGLSGELLGDGGALLLRLPAQAVTVRYPHVFREPFVFARLEGEIAAFRTDTAWRIETPTLAFEGQGYGGELRGGAEIEDSGTRPLLDLYAVVTHGEVPAARLFWPVNVMPKQAVAWLNRGLAGGTIAGGRAVIRGDLDDWPFDNRAGRFDALADVRGARLDYHPDWPHAEDIDAVAEFVNAGMHIEARAGSVLGNRVTHAVADIADFGHSVLDLNVQGVGSGPALLAFLNASPIGKRYAGPMRGLRIGGKGDLAFHLSLPLAAADAASLDGTLMLSEADIASSRWPVQFGLASGPVRFNASGFEAGPLTVGFRGRPASLRLAAGGFVSAPTQALEARLIGNFPAETVFTGFDALAPLWRYFPGSADWQLELTAEATVDSLPGAMHLRVGSDLRGIASDLPAPLAKASWDALPVDIRLGLPIEGSDLDLALGEVLRLRARLSDAKRGLALSARLDGLTPEALPESGLRIGGNPAEFDLDGWAMLGIGTGRDALPLRGLDLHAQRASIGRREFTDLGLQVTPLPAGDTEIRFGGPALDGRVRLPATPFDAAGVTAEFNRLYWPEAPPGEATDEPGPLADFVPASLPPLHLRIADFRLGQASFGKATLESRPLGAGMHFDRVETDSPNVKMQAQGDWTGAGGATRSSFRIDFSAGDLGRMLDALGYAGLVAGGQTRSHIEASWPGPPSAFTLARLDGRLSIGVAEGRFLDVEPGMGRLFGLFSLREIPRRLALDFGDFFQSGMTFTSIDGEFELRDGNAYTRNLKIIGPAADIRIDGRTGIRAKDYDQQMVVVPHVGGTLPVVGAIAGGPAGAAAGLAVQTLFNKAINQVTAARYRVTGSWEKPVITLVAREGARRQDSDKGPPRKEKSG